MYVNTDMWDWLLTITVAWNISLLITLSDYYIDSIYHRMSYLMLQLIAPIIPYIPNSAKGSGTLHLN